MQSSSHENDRLSVLMLAQLLTHFLATPKSLHEKFKQNLLHLLPAFPIIEERN